MNEFDDPIVSQLLDQASGPAPDADLAYGAVLGRVRRAKQRRLAAAVGGTGLACALGLVVAVSITGSRGDERRIAPADPIDVSTTVPGPAPTPAVPTTVSGDDDRAGAPSTSVAPSTAAAPSAGAASTPSAPGSAPPAPRPPASTSPAAPPPTSPPTTAAPASSTPTTGSTPTTVDDDPSTTVDDDDDDTSSTVDDDDDARCVNDDNSGSGSCGSDG